MGNTHTHTYLSKTVCHEDKVDTAESKLSEDEKYIDSDSAVKKNSLSLLFMCLKDSQLSCIIVQL